MGVDIHSATRIKVRDVKRLVTRVREPPTRVPAAWIDLIARPWLHLTANFIVDARLLRASYKVDFTCNKRRAAETPRKKTARGGIENGGTQMLSKFEPTV
jgi:hypothetical protein